MIEANMEAYKELMGRKGAIVMTLLEKKREEGKFEVVENMLKDGVEVALIANWTKLSKVDIEKIKVKIDKE